MEYQIKDRMSFMRFLNLSLEDKVPDAKTIWAYKEINELTVFESYIINKEGTPMEHFT